MVVTDKDEWLSEFDSLKNNIIKEHIESDWIVVFESQVQANDKEFDVPYRETKFVYSCLVKDGFTPQIEYFENNSFMLKLIKYHNDEAVTVKQAKVIIELVQKVLINTNK